ncbi:hypothetical protein EG68_03356 [Paragonimus skrjabini miyazakii]|uniref:DNA replication ATP-dependent helicase/nuclease n=1 Tax=Paragonimus skrjabini miyazakii TaxID=59628 RepID=A0A8S9Z982_9TREM|nr:hypothetical protein EG68_03356 [Paragonimus skrjabini miyazakii]
MKRQTNLLGFFQSIPGVATRNASLSPARCSATFDHTSPQSDGDASFIIPDTPDQKILKPTEHLPSPGSLTARPALMPVQFNRDHQTSTPRRRAAQHRRSSLTVRRQAELMDKYSAQPSSEANLDGITPALQMVNQVRTAAKIRRGNYDSLNYAPIDQLPPEANKKTQYVFSPRSELLVAKAIALSNRTKRQHCCSVTQDKLQHTRKSSALCATTSLNLGDTDFDDFVDRYLPTKPHTGQQNTDVMKLNTQENEVLNEVLGALDVCADELPSVDNKQHASKARAAQICCVPASSSSAIEVEFGYNDDRVEQFDLSDWLEPIHESPRITKLITKLLNGTPVLDQSFYRGVITAIERSQECLLASLKLTGNSSIDCEPVSLELLDSWASTDLLVGDTVHILLGTSGCTVHGRHVVLNDGDSASPAFPGCLIQHPDTLIAGTKLVGSFYCERRSVLEQFWPGGDDGPDQTQDSAVTDHRDQRDSGRVMLIGCIVHELFQKLILDKTPSVASGHNLLDSILQRSGTALQLYACGITLNEIRPQLVNFVGKILDWIGKYCYWNNPQGSNAAHPVIHKVVDVEENIWSTRFGIKGKIDLSVLCRLPKALSHLSSTPNALSLVPLELKTGRPTYSLEHKGQVLLYILMLIDRYGSCYTTSGVPQLIQTANVGWLVYLQNEVKDRPKASNDPGLVLPHLASFRGLLQTRNRIASQLLLLVNSAAQWNESELNRWSPRLPSPVRQLHTCQMCPVQLACSLFSSSHEQSSSRTPNTGHGEYETVANLLLTRRAHLSPSHVQFFIHWSHLVLLEYTGSERLEDVVARIACSDTTRSTDATSNARSHSGTVRQLKVVHTLTTTSDIFGLWRTILIPAVNVKTEYSVETGPGPGFTLGTILSFTRTDWYKLDVTTQKLLSPASATFEERTQCVFIQTDRRLPTWIDCFRLDRYVTPKVMQLNLSNLLGLMQNSPICDYLRGLIIDGTRPLFQGTLSKQVVSDIRAILKHLNTCQRTAILRVLMAKHYVLIKGYPGTGKTETLSSLLRVLARLQKKVLVVTHTHSAVDNLLARLIKCGEKRVLRLGSVERIAPELVDYCFEHRLNEYCTTNPFSDPSARIQSWIEDAAIVGCTALAASGGSGSRHVALIRARFDLVLVDEASQLLLPTVLGALICLCSSDKTKCNEPGRFVLVGDPHQLPPLVQSSKACQAGLDRSLFTHLLDLCERPHRTAMDQTHDPHYSSLPNGHVVELNLQYRMNAPILRLANELSYSNSMQPINSVVSDATLADRLYPLSSRLFGDNMVPIWLGRALSPLLEDSVLLLDTFQWNSCSGIDRQYSNQTEAMLVVFLVRLLLQCGLDVADLGVIAPHRSQVALLNRLLAEPTPGTIEPTIKRQLTTGVEVNTVDQFQGRDKRAIVLSLTVCTLNQTARRNPSRNLLEDLARLTVALTRAKHKLLIVGCSGRERSTDESHDVHLFAESDGVLCRLFELLSQSNDYHALTQDDLAFVKRLEQM